MSFQIEETFYHIDVHEQEIVGNIKEFVLYGLGRQEAAINSPEVECGLQQKKKPGLWITSPCPHPCYFL